jgi:RecA/RadA recombinase
MIDKIYIVLEHALTVSYSIVSSVDIRHLPITVINTTI